jgi:hypothetical protein
MSDPWDDPVKDFLRKTGDEFRRFSHDVREDAQRLLREVRDPRQQQRLRDGLLEVGSWARKTAQDMATVIEDGLKKAEKAVGDPARRPAAPAPTAPSPPPAMEDAAPPPAASAPPVAKTVGPGSSRRGSSRSRPKAKKTLGRRPKAGAGNDE